MPAARLVVVLVVGRRDLHRTGSELALDDVVGDDRDDAIDERDQDAPADEGLVARVIRVNGHGGVAQDRLGPRSRDGDRRAGVRLAGLLIDQVVTDEPQRARLLGGDDLQI